MKYTYNVIFKGIIPKAVQLLRDGTVIRIYPLHPECVSTWNAFFSGGNGHFKVMCPIQSRTYGQVPVLMFCENGKKTQIDFTAI